MALVYEHRAWDTINLTFVYWQAPNYDPTGAFWPGPPPFGDLTDVLVQRVFDDGITPVAQMPFAQAQLISPSLFGAAVPVGAPTLPAAEAEKMP